MKTLKSALPIFIIVALASSCTPTDFIQSSMNSKQYSMQYLHDSRKINEKSKISVYLDTVVFNDPEFANITKVKRDKRGLIPLVFVYLWKERRTCTVGKHAFKEEIGDFFKESFEKEIKRSSILNIDTNGISEYTLSLSIDKFKTAGPYITDGTAVFYVLGYFAMLRNRLGPAVSEMDVTYQLRKGKDIILENNVESKRKQKHSIQPTMTYLIGNTTT